MNKVNRNFKFDKYTRNSIYYHRIIRKNVLKIEFTEFEVNLQRKPIIDQSCEIFELAVKLCEQNFDYVFIDTYVVL